MLTESDSSIMRLLRYYTIANGALLVIIAAAVWFSVWLADQNAIPPNTVLGFRTEHTLVSSIGWFAGQRAGFLFAAIGMTAATGLTLLALVVLYKRQMAPMWLLVAPAFGWLGVVAAVLLASGFADAAAVSAAPAAALSVFFSV